MLVSSRRMIHFFPYFFVSKIRYVQMILFDYCCIFLVEIVERPIVLIGSAAFLAVHIGMFFSFLLGLFLCLLVFMFFIFFVIFLFSDTSTRWRQMRNRACAFEKLAIVFAASFLTMIYAFLYISYNRYQSDLFYHRHIINGDINQVYQGCIVDAPTYNTQREYDSYILRAEKGVLLSFYSSGPLLHRGDFVEVSGRLSYHRGARNPGGFDAFSYFSAKGIYMKVSAENGGVRLIRDKYRFPSVGITVSDLFNQARNKICTIWDQALSDDESAVMAAMVLGNKAEFPNELKDRFRLSNLSHLIAVSGLHVGCYLTIVSIFTKAGGHRKFRLIVTMCALIFFGFLVGWSASVFRAVMMSVYRVFSSLIGKKADSFSALFFSALFMFLTSPYYLADLGFQLSFFATLSILLASEGASGFLSNFIPRCICDPIALMLAAWVGMLPILVRMYSKQSLLLMIICLLGTLLSQWICLLGIPSTILSALIFLVYPDMQIIRIIFLPVRGLLFVLISITEIGAFENIRALRLQEVQSVLAIGSIGLLVALIMRKGFLKKGMLFLSCVLIVLGSVLQIESFIHRPLATIIFFDVGQGDSALILTRNKSILIDGGEVEIGDQVLLPAMNFYGIQKPDITILSHLHSDHWGGIMDLHRKGRIAEIGVSFWGDGESYAELVGSYQVGDDYYILKKWDRFEVEKDIELLVLHPTAPYCEGGNEDSIVLLLQVGDIGTLFMGDAGFPTEKILCQDDEIRSIIIQKTDIMKVGHHGSKYSSSEEFLDLLSLRLAIISVGNNFYGHPTQEAIKRLQNTRATVMRTDEEGAVLVDIYDDKAVVRSMCA